MTEFHYGAHGNRHDGPADNCQAATGRCPRPLHKIAAEIAADWSKPWFGAVPYIQAMASVDKLTDAYGADDGEYLVRYFLGNAGTWRGETARRIKAELRAMLAGAR